MNGSKSRQAENLFILVPDVVLLHGNTKTQTTALTAAQEWMANRMDELISRQAAYEALTDYYHHRTDIQHMALHEALNRVPTVRARWEYVDYGGVGNWHCSRCRAIGKKDYEYCPHCGALMKGIS